MRILSCFFKILKKKRGYIMMYLAIFFSIAIAMSLQGGNSEKNYENQKIAFCVFDEDQSEISKGLTDYLKKGNEWVEVEDEEEVIQEKMYNRNLTCVVRIPKAFGETMGEGKEQITVRTIPGTMYGTIMEQSIQGFVSLLRGYLTGGMNASEALQKTMQSVEKEPEVEMTTQNGGVSHDSAYYLFAYVPYLFLAIFISTLTPILIIFRKKEIAERMACSSYPKMKIYRELYFSFIIAGLVITALHLIIVFAMKRELWFAAKGGLYIVNEIAFLLVTLSLVFLISQLATKIESINMISNVVSLAMSFLCGIFVPLSFLGDGVKTAAHFLPAYWYILAAERIDAGISKETCPDIWMYCGIQVLFAVVLLTTALVVKEKKSRR
ncbi:aBC-2 type transporter [Roseburia sp. CAG:309]|nr:aBC-2 type transporter [Roseburia sp. CAG:309]